MCLLFFTDVCKWLLLLHYQSLSLWLSTELRCVYFRKLVCVSPNVTSNNCWLVLDWTDMLLWTVIWMFPIRTDCQMSLFFRWAGEVSAGVNASFVCLFVDLNFQSLTSSLFSSYGLNPFGHNEFLNHFPLIHICKTLCCQQYFTLLLSLIISSSSSHHWPSTRLHPFWIISVFATSHFSDRLWRSYCDAGCQLMEMLSRFIAGPSADSRKTSNFHINPFISSLGEFPW